jgi:hypothetical protein
MASLLLVALNTWTSRGVLFVLSDQESMLPQPLNQESVFSSLGHTLFDFLHSLDHDLDWCSEELLLPAISVSV